MNFSEVIEQSILNNKNLNKTEAIPIKNNDKKTKRINLKIDEKSFNKIKK